MTPRPAAAAEADKIGLISRVVAAGTALDAALETAVLVAGHAPSAIRFAKQAVDHAVSPGLAEGLQFERRLFHLSFATGEFQEGMSRFLAKRASSAKS